jgi:hypothetical protein
VIYAFSFAFKTGCDTRQLHTLATTHSRAPCVGLGRCSRPPIYVSLACGGGWLSGLLRVAIRREVVMEVEGQEGSVVARWRGSLVRAHLSASYLHSRAPPSSSSHQQRRPRQWSLMTTTHTRFCRTLDSSLMYFAGAKQVVVGVGV